MQILPPRTRVTDRERNELKLCCRLLDSSHPSGGWMDSSHLLYLPGEFREAAALPVGSENPEPNQLQIGANR